VRSRKARASPFPDEYLVVARERDRWFGLGIFGVLVTLAVIGRADLYWPILLALPGPAAFVMFAAVRFNKLDNKSGRLLEPWLERNPYRGRWKRWVAPLRRFALTHPLPVGLSVSVFLFALLLLALIARHHLGS
jgi:hypothetical protein